MAIDIGARETIIVNSGISSYVAGLLPDGSVEFLNGLLGEFKTQLNNAKTTLHNAFESIVTEVKQQVDNVIDQVADKISQQIQSTLAQAKDAVGTLVTDQLSAATSGLSDQLLTPILNNLTGALLNAVPEGTLRDMVKTIVTEPVESLLKTAFEDLLKEAMQDSVDQLVAAVSDALNSSVGKVGDKLKAAIHKAMEPQVARITVKLNGLIAQVENKLAPVIETLEGIANIKIGDDFKTIEGLEAEVTAIGISDANAFIGLPPSGGLDFSQPIADQDGIGIFVQNFNMALAMFKPVLSKQLPTFIGAKITADAAGFTDGGADILNMTIRDLEVELNLGKPLLPVGPLLGKATIDFKKSFPAEVGGQPGYSVDTGTSSEPIILDFTQERILASVSNVTIQVAEFVYISGSIALEKGAVRTVKVAPGLSTDAAQALLDELNLPDNLSIPATGAPETELSFMTVGGQNLQAFVGINGPYKNDAGVINDKAIGIVVEDFDFAVAMMKPTNPLEFFTKYISLKASAELVSLVGIDDMTLKAERLDVEINLSTPVVSIFPLFPVVNYAATEEFASEELPLFDVNDDGLITLGELATLNSQHNAGLNFSGVSLTDPMVADHDLILKYLDTNQNGILSLAEAAALFGGNTEAKNRVSAADVDSDGKIDPLGLEVRTGGVPQYFSMDSVLIRAQGYIELDIFSIVTLQGSIAFEMGPKKTVDIVGVDGSRSTDELTTMTIGASSVYGFIGWDGPYFLDGNDNKRLDRNSAGNPLPGEVNSSAKGFALNDLNLGIFVGVSVDLTDPKGYVALNLDIDSFEAVGLDFLDLDATLAVRINVGLSLDSVGAIDFTTSFPDDGGFRVNTGDPANPVLLDFDSFLVNIEFAGNMTILAGGTPILAILGTLYVETDGTQFKLFASANLRIGPDISVPAGGTPLLDISALGVIVINSSGFAADLDVDLDVGLDDIGLSFGVSARIIVNTTGVAQEVRIPQRLIDFLNESDSPLKDDVLGRLVACEDGPGQCYAISAYAPDISDIPTVDNLLHNPTGTIKYTTATSYIVAIISGNVEFAGFASGSITAGILVSPSLFQLYVDLHFMIGTDGMGLQVDATGLMEVSDAGLYFRTDVAIKASLTSMLTIDVSGILLIDTTGASDPTGQGADRFMLDLRGSVSIARLINVDGHIKVDVGVAGANTWRFDVGLTGRLGPIVVTGTAWIQSDGQFSVSLYGGIYFGIPGFSISGGLGGTISLTKSGRNYFYNPSDAYTLDISITGSVRLEIIGIGLGASLTLGGRAVFDPASPNTVLSLYAEGCVEILGIETCGGGTIASVAIPVSIFPTPPPILASVDENGHMQLNVGARSSQRKVANSTTDEEYRMTDMGAGRVRIEAFGYTETYSGITSIEGDFGGGNDTLILMDGFSVPVTAHGGTGNDLLASLGTRAVVFYGDDGNDTLIGGNGADELFGGAGDDYLDGGLGVDSLDAGAENDLVYGTIASLAGDTILGGLGTDSLDVHGTASADAFTVSADAGRLKIVRGTGGTMYASGFEDVVLTPEEGADTAIWLALLPEDGPTGGFFRRRQAIAW